MTPTASPSAGDARRDVATISLIGLAHGSSHFFHLLLPPMFPAFIRDFGLSYAELGLLVTVFFVVSGVGQALAGFVVDRIGARPVLYGAMGCFIAGSLAAAAAQGFAGLALAAVLAGLGNAPLHPADFTILNRRISPQRLGHAFSVHGISGNLGWALAPVFLIGLTAAFGSWRAAYLGCALLGAAVLVLLVAQRELIDDHHDAHVQRAAVAGATEHPMAFLKLPSVWLCFSFFFWTTAALSAIQSFASPALQRMYGLPLSTTAFVVTGYMLCGAAGMIVGGFLVARAERLERVIAGAMALAAALLLLVASGWLPGLVAAAAAALAGFGTGLAGPSRDMLIKRAAPPGATGRVYGTVYSGLDVGFALSAPVFGALMDAGLPNAVFGGSAAAMALGVLSASFVGLALHRRRRLAPA
ncbi:MULTISPECIES: MFS transporter [Rubrivivax]|uniref:MFS transporter n=1 Tax=Rubrivivax benzoatilyticus TaxID=316997 RepID=A0ABX0I076_9BURK|nr:MULTISPECIES: MFS transporter [Rubrivivax]MCD0417885.1 MFS transporter [Rubrivivax sp. JA1024]EGJ12563.1 putative transmembrane transport protein [Rubrivivax benzoatilyticus JA2 = ATCC BAA-35]MCC9598012.1 MFS transporter [Rubrivivax sp. JA1055]NHK98970.1 MFS transporter [Rubrivivax benzoatilyticus]NHL25167.1 MFS transporter [Rubrivivax benzoatilyticus]